MVVKRINDLQEGKKAKITAVAYAVCTANSDIVQVIKLYSYGSLVCVYELDKQFGIETLYFTVYYDYSITTIKHLHDFLKSFGADLPVPTIRKEFQSTAKHYFDRNGFGYTFASLEYAEQL